MHGSLNVLLGIGVIAPFNQAVGTILLAKQKWKSLYSIHITGLSFNISLEIVSTPGDLFSFNSCTALFISSYDIGSLIK